MYLSVLIFLKYSKTCCIIDPFVLHLAPMMKVPPFLVAKLAVLLVNLSHFILVESIELIHLFKYLVI